MARARAKRRQEAEQRQMGAAAATLPHKPRRTDVHKNGNKIGKVTAAAKVKRRSIVTKAEKPHTQFFGKAKESHQTEPQLNALTHTHNSKSSLGKKLQTRRKLFECVTVHLWHAQVALEMSRVPIEASALKFTNSLHR